MEAPDMGPAWIWQSGCLMAFVGILAVIFVAIYGIIWLANHIQIV